MSSAALAALAALVLLASAGQARAAGGWWTPPQHLTWYWQLTGKVDNDEPVAAYDIDGFENSAAEVATLHAQGKHTEADHIRGGLMSGDEQPGAQLCSLAHRQLVGLYSLREVRHRILGGIFHLRLDETREILG